MIKKQLLHCGGSSFELLTDQGAFVGLGRVWIDKTLVRSGRLPLTVRTQAFTGLELAGLKLLGVKTSGRELRIQTQASFRQLDVKLMRDHSFDPIHELGDWDKDATAGTGKLDLVLRPSRDRFNGVAFDGFAYHWEYQSKDVPLFYLMDMASWELGGNIAGATAVSQSSCSAPVCKFDRRNAWSTEGILFFLVEQGNQNPIMTHNLPRWSSHGSFDFQFKGDKTLIGVFEKLELIRSVQVRDAGKPELKCFDKHIFDQSLRHATAAKKILLNTQPKTPTAQQNLWTWVSDEVDARARGEFGLKEEPFVPILAQNFWVNFMVESYYKDLLPAAAAIGCRRIFVDNLKKSEMTEAILSNNMCCPHELEIAKELGGVEKVKEFVERAKALGVGVISWTNNMQAFSSPLNREERGRGAGWYVLLEDARQKWGGAYMGGMSAMDVNVPEVQKYLVNSHVKIKRQTGLDAYLFDSFYNLGFMPVTYRDMQPRTQWRALLKIYKQLQDRGVHFTNESFGPFGRVQHGHPSSYNFQTLFACYKVGLGNDYTTVPTGHALKDITPKNAAGVYYALAHMAYGGMPLFDDGKRIDAIWGDAHKRALADYHAALPHMHRRDLQEDGLSVWWRDKTGKRATVFNFKDRLATLPGEVLDLTTGRKLAPAAKHRLEANHTYVFKVPATRRARK